ncbi:glycosyltransferase [Yunchengibacter salinarum]|uniref:glycosyltransferase n=1 Tax=Yunchengibacter salinarum TaxID=3133399 RepID=UPI0035B680C9
MRIVTFSSLYPNAAEPSLGVFVENRLRRLVQDTDVTARVVAPVPWFPVASPLFGRYGRMAAAPGREERHGLDVQHPRFVVLPRVGMGLTPTFLAHAGLKAVRRLQAEGYVPDLLDSHYLYPDGVAACRMASRLNLPFVMTARGSDVTTIARHYPRARARILAAAQAAHRIITVSRALANELMDMGVAADRISVLRNGVDIGYFQPRDRLAVRRRLALKGQVLLFAGWLIPRKRPDLMLDLAEALPDVSVLLAGDGPLRSGLERETARRGLQSRVRFLGQQRPEAMPELYSAADLLILPSEREGWANVLLEAMACGTPVVTRDVGGAPDLMKDPRAGRMVEGPEGAPRKALVARLTAAVRDLLSDGAIDRKAVRTYAAGFGWSRISRAQADIFRDAINRHGQECGSGVETVK